MFEINSLSFNVKSNQSIYIPSLNSYYPPESVINSAYRKVLDFKENAEKILEKEKSETLNLNEFSKAILECKFYYQILRNIISNSETLNLLDFFSHFYRIS